MLKKWPLTLALVAVPCLALAESGHPAVAASLYDLASLYTAREEFAAAEPLVQRALSITRRTLGADDRHMADGFDLYANILDGLGAYELDKHTVRVFANHELTFGDGYAYEVSDGNDGTFSMTGARVSYFDINKFSKTIVDAGLAYNVVYDANGNIATDTSFLPADQDARGCNIGRRVR